MTFGTQAFQPIQGHVVVVEDDPVLGVLLQDILEEAGADCVLFGSADDALMHLLQSPKPCMLLITDYLVPGQLNGVDLAGMVCQKWPGMPVILTTGYTLDHTPLPAGVFCLQKPWAIVQLMAAVETAMALQGHTSLLVAGAVR